MTLTLDDVSFLLHILIDGMLLSHESMTRYNAMEMMMRYLGSSPGDALDEVNETRGAHARFSYLRRIFKERIFRIYLMYLVGITLFTNKSTTYMDVAYLRHIKDLEIVVDFSWGAAALSHLYRELNHATHWNFKHLSGYMTLLQV